jgi:beta-lactamase class A
MTLLETYIAQFSDKTIAVALSDVETAEEIYINADESFHPASTFKVHVMMEVFRQAEAGALSLDDCLPIINSFTSIADGSKFSLSEEMTPSRRSIRAWAQANRSGS